MAVSQVQRHCPVCGRPTLHERHTFGFGWGCLLTVLTGGIFLIVWAIIAVVEMFKPWRCQVCGKAKML